METTILASTTFMETIFGERKKSLITSRPGNGKVGWSIQKLMEMAKQDKHILAFSLEAQKKQFEYMGKNNGQESLSQWTIIDKKKMGIDDIEKAILNSEKKIDILYIDNVDYLLGSTGKVIQKRSDYHQIIDRLAGLCDEHLITLIIGKGINNDIDARGDKRPTIKDVKLNNNTKNLFDNVIGLYREEYYEKNSSKENMIEVLMLQSEENTESFEEYYRIK